MASKNYEDKTLDYLARITDALEAIAATLDKMQQGNPLQAQPKRQPPPDDYPATEEKQPDE